MTFHPHRRAFLGGVAASTLALDAAHAGTLGGPRPPKARIEPVIDELWGEQIVDDYRWMENDKDPDWLPYLRGQTAVARAKLDATPQRARLLKRIAELSGAMTVANYPKPAGELIFYERRDPGQTKERITVRLLNGTDQALIDPASFAKPGSDATIDWWEPAPDGRHLVFGISLGGDEASVGHVMETATGRILPERLLSTPYPSVSWLPDGSGFFYNRFAGKPPGSADYYLDRSVWLHRVGTEQTADLRVMARGLNPVVGMKPISSPDIQTGVGSDHLVMAVREGYARDFDLYAAPRAEVTAGQGGWRLIAKASDGVVDYALSGDELFLTSTAGAPRGRLLKLDVRSETLAEAHVVRPEGPVVIDELNAGRGGVFVTLNDGGEQSLAFVASSGVARPIALPFTGWMQSVQVARDDGHAVIRATSWLDPAGVFVIDPATGVATKSDLQPPPKVDLSLYESRRVFATARDGVKVPISIVARKGARMHGPSPCMVRAYGAYQWPQQPNFIVREVAFLEAGGVLAVAHVRGGGEYGKPWHEAGQKATKPNTWRDLIACCETLIAQGWTSPSQLAIDGGSAGGIAVGRAMTERPDLFCAVISKVGMSNPLRAEFEPNGQPNVPEFGSVKTREGFQALKAMDSYHAVKSGVRYPPMLLLTGINDARTAPHNAAKMAARLQAADPSGEVLLKVDFEAGHEINGRAKDSLDNEFADDFAFVLSHARRPRPRPAARPA